jgi:hypothetical protein
VAEPPNGKGEETVPKLLWARPPENDDEERCKIRKLAGSRHAPGDWIFRARIISPSWQGLRAVRIAEKLGCHPKTVRKRLHRFNIPPAPGWSLGGHRIKAPLEYGRGPEKVWVFGALRVEDGKSLTFTSRSRNSKGYIKLLEKIESAIPRGLIYLIADNLKTHKSVMVREWLEKHQGSSTRSSRRAPHG